MKSLLDYCGCSAAAGRELEARKLPRCSSYFAALPIKKSEERIFVSNPSNAKKRGTRLQQAASRGTTIAV